MLGWSGANVARTPFTYSLIAKINNKPSRQDHPSVKSVDGLFFGGIERIYHLVFPGLPLPLGHAVSCVGALVWGPTSKSSL